MKVENEVEIPYNFVVNLFSSESISLLSLASSVSAFILSHFLHHHRESRGIGIFLSVPYHISAGLPFTNDSNKK